MKFKIITDNLKVEEALVQIVAHNDEEFLKAGFITEYAIENDGYSLTFKFLNPMAKMGMTNVLGRRLMLRSIKDKLKHLDKDIKIEIVKEIKER
jgi:hypothetical protein